MSTANTCQIPDWAAGYKASTAQKSRGVYKHQNERWEMETAFVHVGLENSWIKQTPHECQHGFLPNKMQSGVCGVKENGLTDFQSWKKSQQEKERKVSWEQQLLDVAKLFHTRKAVRWCGTKIRVHRGVFTFSQNSEEQQHNSVDWNSTRVTQPGPDGSIPLLSWITDVLSKVARSHLIMPWSTKLQDLRKQRTWEPKMWSFLSVESLMQLLLSRAKSDFSWLLNPLLWL